MKTDKCLCGRKIDSKSRTIALNRCWHDKCFNLYKKAYSDGYDKIYGKSPTYINEKK